MKKLLMTLGLVAGSALLFSACQTGKNGSYTAYVTAVEQSGLIWKNYVVYMKSDLQSSNEDIFCIPQDNQELANQLVQVERSKKQVVVHYDNFSYILPMSRCAGDVITSFDQNN